MKHKTYLFIALLCVIGISSCNDFLDVSSSEKVLQKDLFKDSQGFRLAVNGVYSNLSSPALYGENLSWGFLSAIGHNYEVSPDALPEAMLYAANFDWKKSSVEAITDNIWTKGYNIIAGCNNIIQETEARDSTFFKEKGLEKNLILGEMYGVRAMIHFDLLRLFAPAPINKYQGKTIPYVKKYPDLRPENLTTVEVLQNIVSDMTTAKKLLAPIDTLTFHREMSRPGSPNKYKQRDNFLDIEGGEFFNYRCQRMNFFAATTLLARTYLYMQDYQKAYENAKLIHGFIEKRWFGWTSPYYQGLIPSVDYIHIKKPDESFLMFSNNKNFDNIEKYTLSDPRYGTSRFKMNKMEFLFEGEFDDFRYNGWYNRYGLKRYLTWMRPKGTSPDVQSTTVTQGPLIPVARLSEIFHILIECNIRKGDIPQAVTLFNTLRINRGVRTPLPYSVDANSLMEKLVNDIIRETLTEGQTFFMYKRLNHDIFNGETNIVINPQSLTIPIPYSETAY